MAHNLIHCSFNDDDDDDFQLFDDDAEISRLQLPAPVETPLPEDVDDRIARIEFHCSACDMREQVHYYGRDPPFALGIKFREDNFVMRDPFQPPPPRWQARSEYYVTLGVKCARCGKVVCKDISCSFCYTKTYCLPCSIANLKSWPVEAQSRLRKQLAANKK